MQQHVVSRAFQGALFTRGAHEMHLKLLTQNTIIKYLSSSFLRRNVSTTIDYISEGIPIIEETTPDGLPRTIANPVVTTFQDVGVISRLCHALAREKLTTPTPIQALALPHTLQNSHDPCIIQAETGSGKTLTYLVPALQDTRPGLTTLIITPSRELAAQVFHLAKKLAGKKKVSRRVSVLFSGHNEEELLDMYRETKPHIVIGTPTLLQELIEREAEKFKYLRRLVLDEGDHLLRSLSKKTSWRLKRTRELHPKPARVLVEHLTKMTRCQLICTSATIPNQFREELAEIGWGNSPRIISTIANMTVPASIIHQYIVCNEDIVGCGKLETMVEHFREHCFKQAIVFIHRGAPINQFVNDLIGLGVQGTPLYSEATKVDNYGQFLEQFENGDIEMVVGTEETVRGLDFPFVETIYLIEVPRNASEYLHIVGRVGRLGRKGLAVVVMEQEAVRDLARLKRIYQKLEVEGNEIKKRVID